MAEHSRVNSMHEAAFEQVATGASEIAVWTAASDGDIVDWQLLNPGDIIDHPTATAELTATSRRGEIVFAGIWDQEYVKQLQQLRGEQ